MAQDITRVEQENRQASKILLDFIEPNTPDEVVNRYAALPARAKTAEFGMFDHNVVVLDTETTGVSFNHDELIQIAAAKMDKGEIVDWFITFVNPGKPISDDIAYLTGIHDEDVADAPSPADALTQLIAFAGDCTIVAHNAEFDRTFTTRHPAGYPLLENIWIDSLDLARIALPRMTSHRLIDLVKAFGAPLSTHRADDDVASTCAIFRILLAAVESMPTPLIREIAGMANSEQWSTSVVFSYFAEKKVSGEIEQQLQKQNNTHQNEHLSAEEDTTDCMDSSVNENANGQNAFQPETFSLRKIRKNRLAQIKHNEKNSKNKTGADLSNTPDKDQQHEQPSELVFPSKDDISKAFSSDGLASTLYDDYEMRPEQLEMAQAVRTAFAQSDNLVVEAGTGVGKSVAYLIPAALTARANNIPIGIATKTNNLLDQLVCHELPLIAHGLSKTLGENEDLTYAALKGFSHYPCLRKIEQAISDGAKTVTIGKTKYSQAPALAALLSYIEQTAYDDIDGLKINRRILPIQTITTTSRDCLRNKCPFNGKYCFVHGARHYAYEADIVVTNHSLLFCDLATEGELLPPIKYWVIDEAHGAEKEARAAFSLELSTWDLNNLALRVSADEASRNVFIRAERVVFSAQSEESKTLFFALTSRAKEAGELFAKAEDVFSSHIKDLTFFSDTDKKSKGYEHVDIWIGDEVRQSTQFKALVGYGRDMAESAEKLITASQELVGYLEDAENAGVVQREIATIAIELKDVIRAVETILVKGSKEYAYAAQIYHKDDKGSTKLEALLYNVGEKMNDTLYNKTSSVVFTSATLTVNNSFAAFDNAMGLNHEGQARSTNLQLQSSFDFDHNMKIYVATDIPEYSDENYLEELQKFLIGLHIAQQGSMLTLFTNRNEMEKSFEEVQPRLQESNLRLLCQKWGLSVKGLRDDFLKDEHLSLFALKSFWEGFDAPGTTLRGVVIPKLPFAQPNDPLSREQAARDNRAWWHHILPASVLEVKQAAGRLIRKDDDCGVLVLADRRLITKTYGKIFLNSLPSKNIQFATMDEIICDIERGQL